MSYRDNLDAAHARIEALEVELGEVRQGASDGAGAKARIVELEREVAHLGSRVKHRDVLIATLQRGDHLPTTKLTPSHFDLARVVFGWLIVVVILVFLLVVSSHGT